jgi:hypothetical protein
MKKYFGEFTDRESLSAFIGYGNDPLPTDFPTDDEILWAAYETPCYEGYAMVVFKRDDKLYEVNGSHCSCMGLEGQWSPEETTWEALKMRTFDYGAEANHHLGALIVANT